MVTYFKKHGLLKTLSYYDVWLFLFYVICFFLMKDFLLETLTSQIPMISIQNFLTNFLPFLFVGFFCYLFCHNCRQKTYLFRTGRSLAYDMTNYRRTYHQLIDYFEDAEQYQMNSDFLPKKSWKELEGLMFGATFHLPSNKDGSNIFIYGIPGCGKTAGPIICSALRWGMTEPYGKNSTTSKKDSCHGSVFCIDIKNDIWNATHDYRLIKCFNLMDPSKSCHFNPLAGVETLSIDDRCIFVESLGCNLLKFSGASNEKYFYDTALDYWTGISLYLLSKDVHISFPALLDKILTGDAITWVKRVIEDGPIESKRLLASKKGENPKNLSGAFAFLCSSIRPLTSHMLSSLLGNRTGAEYISPQCLEEGYDVYIQLDQTQLASYSTLISLITEVFMTHALSREKNPHAGRLADGTLRPIVFILDEFAQLSTLTYDRVAALFMTGRSRNVSVVCALQSQSSLIQMFHSEEACKSLIDCVSTFCFLSIQEVATRQWASALIGTKKSLQISNNLTNTQNSHHTGKTVSETREPIIFPEEFGTLKAPEHGKDQLIIYHKGKYARLEKIYYFK